MSAKPQVECVLFDLDGTLADTAPDLAHALNGLLEAERREPLAFERIRPQVSLGSIALLELAFGVRPGDAGFERLRASFLERYRETLAERTRLFPDMERVLAALEARGVLWGVVTNKPGWLTKPLIEALALDARAACVVSGDTLAVRKPDPAPLLHACRETGVEARRSVYVGDAEKDVLAGRAAGMRTVVALFGYIPTGADPHAWGADATIDTPPELLPWLARADASPSRP